MGVRVLAACFQPARVGSRGRRAGVPAGLQGGGVRAEGRGGPRGEGGEEYEFLTLRVSPPAHPETTPRRVDATGATWEQSGGQPHKAKEG